MNYSFQRLSKRLLNSAYILIPIYALTAIFLWMLVIFIVWTREFVCGTDSAPDFKVGNTGWVIHDQLYGCSAMDGYETFIAEYLPTKEQIVIMELSETKVKLNYDGNHVLHIFLNEFTNPDFKADKFGDVTIEYGSFSYR